MALAYDDHTYDKSTEDQRVFERLPDVLVQDAARQCAYLIPAAEMEQYRAGPDVWARLDDSTVTFVIPDGESIDEIPSFLRNPELDPSVLIRYSRGKAAYFLTFDQLNRYHTSQPTTPDSGRISFILPRGTELIDELPSLRRALMQTQTQ